MPRLAVVPSPEPMLAPFAEGGLAGAGEEDSGAAPEVSKPWAVKRINLLRSLPRGAGEALRELARPLVLQRRQMVFDPGDRGDAVYVIEQGRVKLSRFDDRGREIILSILEEGELFGEDALGSSEGRRTAAEALEETRILRLARADFETLLQSNADVALLVARQMSERLLGAQERLHSLAFRDVSQRLAEALLSLAEAHGNALEDGHVRIGLRLTHQELASLVASTRETVTGLLGRFRREGWLEIHEGRWVLSDPDALRRVVESPR